MATRTGTVIRYHDDKGYGFVSIDGLGRSAFVHYSALGRHRAAIGPGVRVRFNLVQTVKGPKAIDVEPIEVAG